MTTHSILVNVEAESRIEAIEKMNAIDGVSVDFNGATQKLTRLEKKVEASKMLQKYPERANTWIADDLGISMQLVAETRFEMENRKTIPAFETFMRRDGRITPKIYSQEIN